ncbi:MAG: response regulator [Brevibacillus sp.]|nr:response regulator [Brevibacillus sp.]
MIVDDEPLEREVLTMIIKKHNFGVIHFYEATNGAEAVSLARRENIDLTIMDIKMPVMDGITAAEIIKKEIPDCRILFLTAYDEFDYAFRSIKLRADDYLLKPAHPDEIKQALVKLLPSQKGQLVQFSGDIEGHLEIGKVIEYIDQNLNDELSLEYLAGLVHLNAQYLCRLFKQVTGCTIKQYVTTRRLEKAKYMFQSTNKTITEISMDCGFSDANYFARVFKKKEGMTPTQYQQQMSIAEKKKPITFGKYLM